jgi:hypothetical protein
MEDKYILVGLLQGKIPLRKQRCRWKDNMKFEFKETSVRVWVGFMWL